MTTNKFNHRQSAVDRVKRCMSHTNFFFKVIALLFSFVMSPADDREQELDDVAPPSREGDFIDRAIATMTADSDDNNDVTDRLDAVKRYMRFGRRFQQQNEKQLSTDKRYMRFGKRTQSDAIHDDNNSDDIAASPLRLSANGSDRALFQESTRDANSDRDAAAASKRYMRFGRR